MSQNYSHITPEMELVDRSNCSVRYLQHGYPEKLCRWHAHEEYELHFIKKSQGTAYIGDFVGRFDGGSLYLLGPWLPHNWITENGGEKINLRDMLIQFDHESLLKLLSAYSEARCLKRLLEESSSGILFTGFPAEEAERRLAELREAEGMRRLLLFLDFMMRLSDWRERKILSFGYNFSKTGWSRHRRANRAVRYVLDNFCSPMTLKEVASIANMSESAFSRYFREITGLRFSEFVTRVRLGHAATLLLETDKQVATVGYEVGFNNIANFNRHFLRIKGTTPSDYRRNVRSALNQNHLAAGKRQASKESR